MLLSASNYGATYCQQFGIKVHS